MKIDPIKCTEAAWSEIALASEGLTSGLIALLAEIQNASNAREHGLTAMMGLSAKEISKKATEIKYLADGIVIGVDKHLRTSK